MKKLLYSFLILAFISCSNDSVSDVSETADNEETTNDDNNGGDDAGTGGDNGTGGDTGTGGDNTAKITFTNDILPIINNKCSSCHTSGPQTNYTNYNLTKNNASTIINRINRNQGSGGFMPQNGTKLSSAELAKFDQWITDGKLE